MADKDDEFFLFVPDAARWKAIEHVVTTLWSFYAFQQASSNAIDAGAVARELSSGVQGSIVEARMPPEFKAEFRGHVRRLMDIVVANADLADKLMGRKPDDI